MFTHTPCSSDMNQNPMDHPTITYYFRIGCKENPRQDRSFLAWPKSLMLFDSHNILIEITCDTIHVFSLLWLEIFIQLADLNYYVTLTSSESMMQNWHLWMQITMSHTTQDWQSYKPTVIVTNNYHWRFRVKPWRLDT